MGSGGQQVDKRGMINMMKKTRLCQEFMTTSMCKYGDKCTFAHGQHELRAPNPAGAATQGGMRPKTGQQGGNRDMRKTRLCEKFMTTGQCGYGDGCTFAHGLHDMRRPDDPLPPSLLNRPNPSAAKAAAGGGVGPVTPLEQQQQQELRQNHLPADLAAQTEHLLGPVVPLDQRQEGGLPELRPCQRLELATSLPSQKALQQEQRAAAQKEGQGAQVLLLDCQRGWRSGQ
mmetsp:Transcript_12146/g.31996  ORF Transcript_12146/g.31996 Transcript_12146/m.31996 type:complete len:229 (-) Transcript_12146:1806-2492(-)